MACGVDEPDSAEGGGRTKLTSTEVEPAGANCPAGGVAVHTGIDANENDVLDPSEVSATAYTCSHKTLLREEKIGSGAVCPGGGVLVHSGQDLDDSGSLEDSEVKDTATVCYSDELYRGDLKTSEFATAASKDKLSLVRIVTGNVVIDSDAAMPSLELVGGNIDLRFNELVELPSLERIAGNLIGSPGGVRLNAPALAEIGGFVRLTASRDKGTFMAPSLASVEGELYLAGKFEAVDLRALNRVGANLDIDLPQGDKLELSALERVGGNVIVSGWFTHLDLQRLKTAAGFNLVYSKLTSLSLPSLKAASRVKIATSDSLTSAHLPSLSGVTTLMLYRLPNLTALELSQDLELDTLQMSYVGVSDLSLFANLRTIKALNIQANAKLVNLRGLEHLTTVSKLILTNNAKLTDLAGLEHLTKVTGDLTIAKNAALASLSGLAGLTNVSGQISIAENAALPQSEVDAFLQRLGR